MLNKQFRVLGIRAPATHWGDKVAYPGDPMCLAYALTPTWSALADGSFGTLKPEFGELYTPVVWNADAERELHARLRDQPTVVLISTTSPAAPYAHAILKIVRAESDALTVLGGPHADELTDPITHIHPHLDNRWRDLVDLVASGDGGHLVLRLLQLVADKVRHGRPGRGALLTMLREKITGQEPVFTTIPGRGLVTVLTSEGYALARTSGRTLAPHEYGLPYGYITPRARFDCFDNAVTAHGMATFGCTYTCSFCSEGGGFRTQPPTEIAGRADQFMQVGARAGAEAVFFDDPIFLGGGWPAIAEFVRLRYRHPMPWAGQFTFPTLLRDAAISARVLRNAVIVGLIYAYCGLESGSDRVMADVNKSRRTPAWHTAARNGFAVLRRAGVRRIGTSVLFGLPGETDETVDETIRLVEELVHDGLVDSVSPNLVTWHPGTSLTRADGVRERLDFTEIPRTELPCSLFEEADPNHIRTFNMPPARIWRIVRTVPSAWGDALIGRTKFEAACASHT